jgi:hypothetical protein
MDDDELLELFHEIAKELVMRNRDDAGSVRGLADEVKGRDEEDAPSAERILNQVIVAMLYAADEAVG